jgi:hypothetical protein
MIFRAMVEPDLDRILSLIADPAITSVTVDTYKAKLADGQYRPEWTWIAEDPTTGVALAVAIWWGGTREFQPGSLDGVFVHGSVRTVDERITIASDLLVAAHTAYAADGVATPLDYHLFLPSDWHERSDVAAAVAWREGAARRAGLTARVERLRYEWTPAAGLPDLSGRLHMRPEPDDGVFVDLFRRVLVDTLDAASGKAAEQIGPDEQASRDVAFYRDTMLGDRSWWRIAETSDGEAVGFGLPSRNHAVPVVGYLGVLPEHRGHAYVDDILAEITRVLVAEVDADRIRADTDLANVPMAAAFERVGYRNFARRLVLSAN